MVFYFKFIHAERAKNNYSGVGTQYSRHFNWSVTY